MTDLEAVDAINEVVNDAWTANVPAIAAADGNELRWKGKSDKDNPVGFWARVSQQIVSQEIVSHADENTFGNNQRRYETYGNVFVQVFAPMTYNNAYKRGFQIAGVVRDAFRAAGVSTEVWFENARINPLVDDDVNYRWNVVADFRYDTIA